MTLPTWGLLSSIATSLRLTMRSTLGDEKSKSDRGFMQSFAPAEMGRKTVEQQGEKKKKELFIVVVSYDNVRRLHGGFFIHATKVSQALAFVWIFTEYIQVWRSMLRHDMPGKIKCTGRDAKELTARRRSELQKKNVEIINLLLLQSREKYVPVSIVVSSVWMCHCSVCLS